MVWVLDPPNLGACLYRDVIRDLSVAGDKWFASTLDGSQVFSAGTLWFAWRHTGAEKG